MVQPPTYRLKAKNITAISQASDPTGLKAKRTFAARAAQEQADGISAWYEQGGQVFLAWVQEHYRTWTGQPLDWDDPYMEELWIAFGHPWFEFVVCRKPGQVGFTELLIAFVAFSLAYVRVPSALGFEQAGKVRDIIAPRLQPSFKAIAPIQEIQHRYQEGVGRQDIDTKDRKVSVGGIPGTFFWASTSASAKKTKTGNERQVSSSASSFTAFTACLDEIEGAPADFVDITKERQSRCTMRTNPLRAGSTPGPEGGVVDSLIQGGGYFFKWMVTCPKCGHQNLLDPFGNFVKPFLVTREDGEQEERYIDEVGRVQDWFCHDNSSLEQRINTAYVGCVKCEGELTRADINQGTYQCERTGVRLVEEVDRTLANQEAVINVVGIDIPRIATALFKPAVQVRKLVETRNALDALQQGLGLAASLVGGRIDLKRLRSCVRPLPDHLRDREPDMITLGVDQGVAHHWGVVGFWYVPKARTPDLQWQQAHVYIPWWGHIIGFNGVQNIIDEWKVDLVGIDNEPELAAAGQFAKERPPQTPPLTTPPELKAKGQTFLFDQVKLKGEDFRRTVRISQKQKIYVYSLDRTFGLDAVRTRVYQNRYTFPVGTVYDAKDKDNLFAHILSSDRQEGQWIQTPGLPDHLFHALNFQEMVALTHFYEPAFQRLQYTSTDRRGSKGKYTITPENIQRIHSFRSTQPSPDYRELSSEVRAWYVSTFENTLLSWVEEARPIEEPTMGFWEAMRLQNVEPTDAARFYFMAQGLSIPDRLQNAES